MTISQVGEPFWSVAGAAALEIAIESNPLGQVLARRQCEGVKWTFTLTVGEAIGRPRCDLFPYSSS